MDSFGSNLPGRVGTINGEQAYVIPRKRHAKVPRRAHFSRKFAFIGRALCRLIWNGREKVESSGQK